MISSPTSTVRWLSRCDRPLGHPPVNRVEPTLTPMALYPGDVCAGAGAGVAVTLVLGRPLAVVPTRVNDSITWVIRFFHLPAPDRSESRSGTRTARGSAQPETCRAMP